MKPSGMLRLAVCVGLVMGHMDISMAMPGTQAVVFSAPTDAGSTASTPQAIARPTSSSDITEWSAYLRAITQQNSQGLTQATSYLFFVPAGTDDEAVHARERVALSLTDMAARMLRPGVLIAFGGPDSTATADTVVEAFRPAPASWAKGAVVLFIGSAADKARVSEVLATSGATLRFVDMADTASVTTAATGAPLPNFITPPPPPPPRPPPPPPPQMPVFTRTAQIDRAYASKHQPVYPRAAINARHEGTVLVLVRVDPDGKAGEAKIDRSSGAAELDDSALSAVSHWKFTPAYQGDTPRVSWMRVPVNFSLPSAAGQ